MAKADAPSQNSSAELNGLADLNDEMEKRKEKVRPFAKSLDRRIELSVKKLFDCENELNNDQEEETKIALDQNEDTKMECRRAIKDRKMGDFCSRKRENIKKGTDVNPNIRNVKVIEQESSRSNSIEDNIENLK